MSNYISHPYHLVDESSWPILSSISGLGLTCGAVALFHDNGRILFFTSLFLLAITVRQWWRDVPREGGLQGLHTFIVEIGLRWGIALFIISEVTFFLSFFWAFYIEG